MGTIEYTEAETERIAEWVALGLSYSEIAANLPGRTVTAIWQKVKKMGLKAQRKRRDEGRSQRDYLRRILRESAEAPDNSNEAQDASFQAAMRKAITAGLEFAEEGVSLVPCTENPKLIRPETPVCMRSSALICFEHGDNSRDIFA